MKTYDVVLLTDARYVAPVDPGDYELNILQEDKLLTEALNSKGLNVFRTNWDNTEFDWSSARSIVFRTTWDYFHRFAEFNNWLHAIQHKTIFINPMPLLLWNLDKHYLADLQKKGITIPPTYFIEKGDDRSLEMITNSCGWNDIILKPAVGGAARHTYRISLSQVSEYEHIYRKHIREEAFLLQQFQQSVLTAGEVALMVMDGKFTHAILKKAKPGDFRVQDDFGGTVHPYSPTAAEIAFAERTVAAAPIKPIYARVDIIWDDNDNPCVSELEVIEPELWMRFHHASANILAEGIHKYILNGEKK